MAKLPPCVQSAANKLTPSDLLSAKWKTYKDPDFYELTLEKDDTILVTATIQHRPLHCDRGHYMLQVDGPLVNIQNPLDDADRFPRYYMKLRRAKEEAVDFLLWRLFKRNQPDMIEQIGLALSFLIAQVEEGRTKEEMADNLPTYRSAVLRLLDLQEK